MKVGPLQLKPSVLRTRGARGVAMNCRCLMAASILLLSPVVAYASGAAPTVSVLAGGHRGPGWWKLAINPDAALEVVLPGDTPVRRQLSGPEVEQLRTLLAALPSDKPKYTYGDFGADLPVMALEASGRHYLVGVLGADEPCTDDLRALVAALAFLRGRFARPTALDPAALYPQCGVVSSREP